MKLLNWLRPRRSKSITIETTTIDGYTFKVLDPVTMPNIRRVSLFAEDYAREWGIDKTDLVTFIRSIMRETDFPKDGHSMADLNAELVNKMRNIHSLASLLDAVLKADFQYKPFLRAACVVILIDDEDDSKLDPAYTRKKLELCRDNPKIEAFFLSSIRVLLANISSSSDTSTALDWFNLASQKRTESALYSGIDSTIY